MQVCRTNAVGNPSVGANVATARREGISGNVRAVTVQSDSSAPASDVVGAAVAAAVHAASIAVRARPTAENMRTLERALEELRAWRLANAGPTVVDVAELVKRG
jgi:hypothetical protein